VLEGPRFSLLLVLLPQPLACAGSADSSDGESIAAIGQTYTTGTAVGSDNNSAPIGAAVRLAFSGGLCSGSKISPTRFLTAAHCALENTRSVSISNATNESAGSTFTVPSGHFWVHPTWDLTNPPINVVPNNVYDVAVFDVNEASPGIPTVTFNAQPVLNLSSSISLTAVGYGKTGPTCGTTPTAKLENSMSFDPDGVVDRRTHFITHFGLPVSCDGDSGGPLIRGSGVSATVVGADSKRRGCGESRAIHGELHAPLERLRVDQRSDGLDAAGRSGPDRKQRRGLSDERHGGHVAWRNQPGPALSRAERHRLRERHRRSPSHLRRCERLFQQQRSRLAPARQLGGRLQSRQPRERLLPLDRHGSGRSQ
jgi:hypothetical protein